MTKITLDEALRRKLGDLTQPLQLCDESGQVVAQVWPVHDMTQWEPITPEPTEEELDRLSKSNEPRYSTAEVLKHLESL